MIGMTGVGKTTVGRALAERLNFDFCDLDCAITEKTGKSPAEIFALHGERTFREIETKELEGICGGCCENLVLSCGGGIVLSEKNRETLKKNTFAVWLVRPFCEIAKNKEVFERPPIGGNIENYIKLFGQREKLYGETCYLKLEYADVAQAVEKIREAISSNL